ncbi:MAG: peptide ABC transporter permease, partial [Peptoniphilaceae bacterium]|nr:peptide ABC transporter permease [Peptoniphilaceae bacterium]
MNTTLKKSVKSYGSFLKNFFLRAFTFSKGEEFNDSNSSFDNKSDDELLHSDNKNVDKGPRKEDENDKL